MKKNVVLLACSRSQASYFSVLSAQLKKDDFAKITFLYYKEITQTRKNFFNVYNQRPMTKNNRLKIVEKVGLYLKRKKNTSSGQKKSKYYWVVVQFVQRQIAYYLFFRYRYFFKAQAYSHLIVWNGKKFHQAIACIAAQSCGISCLYAETGPLPGYMQMSQYGVDASSHLPYQASFYKCYDKNNLSKHTDSNKKETLILKNPIVFVPFQVVEDSNIYCHSPWIANMRELYYQLEQCIEKTPELMVLIKEHPECQENYDDLKGKHSRILFTTPEKSIADLLCQSDFVITINSTVGLESLLQNKSLIVLGEAIYNVEGITQTAKTSEQLHTAVSHIIDGWQPDQRVLRGFIHYITSHYAIRGNMDNPTPEQLTLMSQKIKDIL